MKNITKIALFSMIAVLAFATTPVWATASPYTVVVESWSGSGSNSALMVVDFGEQSFAFGYNWDGEKTGKQMLIDIADATALDVSFGTKYGLTQGISYGAYSLSYDSDTYDPDNPSSWWEYWVSNDGQAWTSYWDGCSNRTLVDGGWDGWGWSPPWPGVGSAPDAPTVPEPTSVIALTSLVGLAASSRLRRRSGK